MQRMRAWTILLVLLGVVWGPPAQAARRSVAVQVLPAQATDQEVAVQVRKIAIDTMENYRNLLTRRYLADKQVKLHEELAELVTEANRKVSTGMRSKVFDEGVAALDQAWLKSKSVLGELPPDLVARLYLGLAMAKAVLGNASLAGEYMSLYINLMPEKGRQSVGYNKQFLALYDRTKQEVNAARKTRVTITAQPADALIGVDGRTWGKSPLVVELEGGGHLVQVEAEGYHRQGWVKDPRTHGGKWTITLEPYVTRTRYLETRERLARHFSPVPPAPEKKTRRRRKEPAPPPALTADQAEGALRSLQEILSSDLTLFVVVHSEGSDILLRGAFVSPFGLERIDTRVARDANIIESVRKVMLAATDLEAQKKGLATLEAARQRERLTDWANQLLEETVAAERTLTLRVEQWTQARQAKKAEMFAATGADVAALNTRLRAAREQVAQQPDEARTLLAALADEWKTLGPKVRSLLAWDVERALRSRKVTEVKALAAQAREGVDGVAALLAKKKKNLAPTDFAALEKSVTQMRGWLDEATQKMSGDPLSSEGRALLYRVLIKEAELRRLLSLV